jgi:hypothetical protein
VVHVPKTAGQSLGRTFKCNYEQRAWLPLYIARIPGQAELRASAWETDLVDAHVSAQGSDETRCMFGHLAYFGVHEPLATEADTRYITFLRDPVERCISSYSYLGTKRSSPKRSAIVSGELSLDAFSLKPGNRNRQLRQLLLGSPSTDPTKAELTREDLEEGKRRLRECWFVGLTETFDEDAHYLYGRLGFRRFAPRRVNATSEKEQPSRALRQAIAGRNALDVELYEYARELRSEFVRRHRVAFRFHRYRAVATRACSDAYGSAPARRLSTWGKGVTRRRFPAA